MKITIFVFPVFRESVFARIHWATEFRSLLMCLLSFFNEFLVSRRLVSSAKWCTVEISATLWRSLMKSIKRIGRNINPWGTPMLIGLSKDLYLLIVACCFQSSRNDLNHLFDLSCIPYYSSFHKGVSWFTVSKTFWTSKTTPQANFSESQRCLIFYVISIKAWLVESWFWKPRWFS